MLGQDNTARVPTKNYVMVNTADIKVSNNPKDVLSTYGLGSCIAVCVYDPKRQVAGMIHYMLPISETSPSQPEQNPAMFGDTGIPILFEKVLALGGRKENLVVKIAGGGMLNDPSGFFNIGERNFTIARKLLWKNNILIAAEDVGGRKSRTVQFHVDDGTLMIYSRGREHPL